MNGNISHTVEHFSQYISQGVTVHIAHQITDGSDPVDIDISGLEYYRSNEIGLSRNRNMLLGQVTDGIGVICDDDISLVADRETNLRTARETFSDVAAITLQTLTPEAKLRKKYATTARKHTALSLLSVSSIEITLDLAQTHTYNLRFDPYYGLGTDIPGGEEQIFLDELRKQKLAVIYVPLPLTIHPAQSSNTGRPDVWKVTVMQEIFGPIVGTVIGLLLLSRLYIQYFFQQIF